MDVKKELEKYCLNTLGKIEDWLRVVPEKFMVDKEEAFNYLNTTKHPYLVSAGDILQEMKKDQLLMHYMSARNVAKTGCWDDYYMEYCCAGVDVVLRTLSLTAQDYLKEKGILTDYDIRDQLLVSDNIYKVSALTDVDKEQIRRSLDDRECVDLSAYPRIWFSNKTAACFRLLVKHLYIHNVGLLREMTKAVPEYLLDWPDPVEHVADAAKRLNQQELMVAASRLKFITDVFSKCRVLLDPDVITDESGGRYSLQLLRADVLKHAPEDREKIYAAISKYINIDLFKDEKIYDWEDVGKKIWGVILDTDTYRDE